MSSARQITASLLLPLAVALCCAVLMPAAGSASTAAAQFLPSTADASVAGLLSSARYALRELSLEQNALQRQIAYSQALTALTGLYQLHGCTWARPRLIELYALPDCPSLHVGYSADGRLLLRVEKLDLRNPAFAGYAIYLCTFESHSSLDLAAHDTGALRFTLLDGTAVQAGVVDEQHPLWPNLKRMAATFRPAAVVYAGTGTAFKQAFVLLPGLPGVDSPSGKVSAVSLAWGKYTINIPFYETEVPRD